MDQVDAVTGYFVDRFREPLMKIYLRGGAISKLMKRIKNEIESTPRGKELSQLYSRQAFYSDTRVREQLGFRPDVELDAGLARSVAWLVHHGQVPVSCRPDEEGHELPGEMISENPVAELIS